MKFEFECRNDFEFQRQVPGYYVGAEPSLLGLGNQKYSKRSLILDMI